MNGRPRILALLATALLGAASLAACGSSSPKHGIPTNAVAAVEGQPVSEAEVKHWIAVAALSHSTGALEKGAVAPDPPTYAACINHLLEVAKTQAEGKTPKISSLRKACEEQYKTLRERAVTFLLTTKWALQEAKNQGVDVSESEVQKAFEKLKAQKFPTAAAEQAILKKTGETKQDVLLQLRLNLDNEKLSKHAIGSSADVSEKEIERYFAQHQSEFGPKEVRSVRLILLGSKAKAEQVKKEIEGGADPAKIANEKTLERAGRGIGGLFSETARGERPEVLDKAIFSAKEHSLGGPLKALAGYYIYEVLGAHNSPAKTVAQARPEIKAHLARPLEEAALKKFAHEFEDRWRQRTECRPGSIVPQCKEGPQPTPSAESSGEESPSSEGQ